MSFLGFETSNTILLTGAGFTHNFGGFLAKTMWSEIHNHLHKLNKGSERNRVIDRLKVNFNYEILYQEVLYSNKFRPQEKADFIEALLGTYDSLDGIIRDYKNRYINKSAINPNLIGKFLSRFAPDLQKKVFLFTLNHDLFIERYIAAVKITCPGVKVNYARFTKDGDKFLEQVDYATLPTQEELEVHKKNMKSLGQFYYIKLHGSYDWRDKDNKNKLIIGTNKAYDIQSEPILKWYYELFKTVLSLPDRRLLIIGYGFRDPHINEAIVESIKNANLTVYIITPQDPKCFRTQTLERGICDRIWNNMAGFYPYTLQDIFNSESIYRNLIDEFINN
ncbi:MAG: SIR2 family protein [Syntrophales bacterium]|nr:SIR2 family protein [Syntrophales bacterium]